MGKLIRLEDLSTKAPVLTAAAAAFYQENCMMCLDMGKHANGVELDVEFVEYREAVALSWMGTVTSQMRRGYTDRRKLTDFGACAIALLLIREFTEYVAVEQSATGDRIDYYLATEEPDDELIFNNTALLEVSGIQEESESNTIAKRIQEKRTRFKSKPTVSSTNTTDTTDLPAYVCVVEFGRPQVKAVIL